MRTCAWLGIATRESPRRSPPRSRTRCASAAAPTDAARITAGAPIGATGVLEASRAADSTVVAAWLLEREQRFVLDAKTLVQLADAGVPGAVTDALVAVSNPGAFHLARVPDQGDVIRADQPTRGRRVSAMAVPYDPWTWGSLGLYDYRYGNPYGYRYGGYGYGYGYGYNNGYYGGYAPPIIIVNGDTQGAAAGQMVKGRGYTQPGGGVHRSDGARTAEPDVRAVADPVLLERLVVLGRLVVRRIFRGRSHGEAAAVEPGPRATRARRGVDSVDAPSRFPDRRPRASRGRRSRCSFRLHLPLIDSSASAVYETSLRIEPHPLLHAATFVTIFPAPLGTIATPAAALDALRLDGPAPVQRDETVRSAVRDLLRHGGYKPTGRGKPASEYLVRAATEGALGSINAAVDVCNAVSLHSALPISVVDLDRARSPFRIGVAPAGASYVFNASGQEIDLSGLLCLFDADGPCANAVRDAQRTKTRDETLATLSVVWGCVGFEDRLEQSRALVSDAARERWRDDARRGDPGRRDSPLTNRHPRPARANSTALPPRPNEPNGEVSRCRAGHAGSADPQSALGGVVPRMGDQREDPGALGRRVPHRPGIALPGSPSHGGARMGHLVLAHDDEQQDRAVLSAHSRREDVARRGDRLVAAVCEGDGGRHRGMTGVAVIGRRASPDWRGSSSGS